MTWDDFYGRYSDWSESTVRARISTLEDIGSGDEVVDVCQFLGDDDLNARLIRKAMRLSVRLSREDLLNLDGEIPSDLFEELCRYTGVSADALYMDGQDDADDMPLDEAIRRISSRKKRKSSAGKAVALGALVGIFKGLAGTQRPHNGRCNGDCAHCPAHYGYRYGRWYYGHGHNYGCEFGGNKGGGGSD